MWRAADFVPFLEIASSPLAPGASPVRLHYRDAGTGPPLVVLHSGWGYEVYPFDRQIEAMSGRRRFVVPDRTGYGLSGVLDRQEVDFHRRAAGETLAVVEALALDRPVLWGHSDGAVIAVHMGLAAPERLAGVILEATHLYRDKPRSRQFFETMMRNPDGLGDRVARILARDHGERWRDLMRINGEAWLKIADRGAAASSDLYDGRLRELRVPALLIHGAKDPRTEPGEVEALRGQLPQATLALIHEGGHSPHSERLAAAAATRAATEFLDELD